MDRAPALPSADVARRRYNAPQRAVVRALTRSMNRALLRSALTLVPIVFLGAVAAGFTGLAEHVGPHNPLLLAAAAAIVLLALVCVLAMFLWRETGGRLGAALDVIAHWQHDAEGDWAQVNPGSRIPRSPGAARRFLEQRSEHPGNLRHRAVASIMLGDLVSARELVARYPLEGAVDRHRRMADEIEIAALAGMPVSADAREAAYREIAAEDPLHAATCRAMLDALIAAIEDRDPIEPLAVAHANLPSSSHGLGRRRAWAMLLAVQTMAAVLVAVGVIAIWVALAG